MQHVAVDSGEPELVEELWKEYFADPTQWWDNRADKVRLIDNGKWIQWSDQQVTQMFVACTRPWAVRIVTIALLVGIEWRDHCLDHCSVNYKCSWKVDSWMRNEHAPGFEDLMMGCGACRGILGHLTLDIR